LLVKEVKRKIAADVTERCGTMRVLDMTEPVDLDRIYTDVNILKKLSNRDRVDSDEVLPIGDREDVHRWMMGKIEKRIDGLKAVDEIQKLVVLGKPGAGKTTFMKYLAMSCLGDKFHGELVPIFVTLKDYAEERGQPSLENYILADSQKRDVSGDDMKRLLKDGKALILLDGLDEMKKEDDRRVKQDIDKFSRDWLKNRFAITCRIAAREYQFEKFTEVEVADFDDEQIATFVNNWFREKDPSKAERLLEKLDGNEPVKELAKTPLLLALLCLVLDETNALPEKQSDLYKQGLNFLLTKIDKLRSIDRDVSQHFRGEQIYKNLSPEDKSDMLGKIAFHYFINGEYFFRQEDLQRQIKNYICNLAEAPAESDALRPDSEVVLKAIEHHHGLLVERARNIYSFSHLTFQEYFTAREIERERQLEILVQNIADPRWKEVFYLTAEMLGRSDNLLRLMKAQIDSIFIGNKDLQEFLLWLDKKVYFASKKYKKAALRAYYAYEAYCVSIIRSSIYITRDEEHSRTLAEAIIFNQAFKKSDVLRIACEIDSNFRYDISSEFNLDGNCEVLQQSLQTTQMLENGFIHREIEGQNLLQWFVNDGSRQACLESLEKSVGFDWEFIPTQVEIFSQYYTTNLLLVECMNRSNVSKEVREEIESTLLLPVGAIGN
jgi:predicted NACHT family NTPase